MKLTSIFLLFIISSFLLSNCGQKAKQKIKNSESRIFDFLKLTKSDTIRIDARFDECGEWGGHKEEIIIDADEKWNIYVHHKIYPYNCDSLKFYYLNDNLRAKFDTTISLTDKKKQAIIEYIQRMAISKTVETFPGHAGNYFSVVTSDSTLIIKIYDDKRSNVDSYNELVSDLFN